MEKKSIWTRELIPGWLEEAAFSIIFLLGIAVMVVILFKSVTQDGRKTAQIQEQCAQESTYSEKLACVKYLSEVAK